jgi:hypothetical protein
MRKANLVVALALVGGAAFVGLAKADKPSAMQGQPAIKLADEPAEVQHLRETRKHLNEAKDAFEKDPVDKKNHRKAILKGIDDSITEVDAEIDELLGK